MRASSLPQARACSTAAIVVAIALLASTRAAHAQSPYELDLRVDVPLLGLGLGGAALALVEVPVPGCFPECSASRINALDRTALGFYSEGAKTVADVLVASAIVLPVVLDAIDSGGSGYAEDMVVLAQALLLTQTAVQLTKHATRRPAPLIYDADSPRDAVESSDAARSFISGHTASAFAATTAFSVTYFLRNPHDPLRWAVLGSGLALSVAVGVLKVLAGYHFWTDVGAGALVGASIGALVPFLHVKLD